MRDIRALHVLLMAGLFLSMVMRTSNCLSASAISSRPLFFAAESLRLHPCLHLVSTFPAKQEFTFLGRHSSMSEVSFQSKPPKLILAFFQGAAMASARLTLGKSS